ncbi:glucose PTS transporter subunit IIA [Lacticaseibacillus manihotivorans]|uniref:PTS system sucrose-specific EIIBCA component n=1 Tax=Lacticaseibacillus manihotivorans DSM 13343 = JCM 12514 TaxID=1423769 RepID=A0A0R1RC68_9LACO|nr:PTS glucose transporter subunit IIABC [Lacticaseibacillus manihotivorans]KRL50995.1 beta-glucosides PTS, EIIABC [Lacticaseibacillus manihotivorans DSM 13343 = JCM 12514]
MSTSQPTTATLLAPVDGQAINLADVQDPVFSKKMMGEGFAIIPSTDQLYSPIAGTVVLVAETGHAIGIRTESGLEVLLHLGIDTVELDGAPFSLTVTEGQQILAGTSLGTMDRNAITSAGKQTTVIVAITNSKEQVESLHVTTGETTAKTITAKIKLAPAPVASVHHSGKYGDLAATIIENVGGKENVKNVIHCITRLRFYLNDKALANDDVIANLDGVIDVAQASGQYQMIIGPAVGDVFDEVTKQLGLDPDAEVSIASTGPDNRTFGQKVKDGTNALIGVITGSMAPVIGMLSASGIIKGMMSLMVSFHWITADSNFYMILNAMSDAVFYFLPVLIGFSAAKRMGGNAMLCAVIGGAIAYPSIIAAGKGASIVTIAGMHFPFVSYTYSIFPMILGAFLATKLEKWLKQHVASYLQAIVVPMITIIVVTTITLLLTGPVITWLADGLANGIQALLSLNTAIFGAIIDGFYQVLVIFGLHWGIVPLFVNDFATLGHSYLFAIVSITMVGQGGAALAVAMKTKNASLRSLGFAAAISAFCGVTEPAIYGINLRYKKTFVAANIGSAVGGLIIGLLHVNMWSIAGSIIGLPSFINPAGIDGSFWGALAATAAALVVAFVLTWVWGFNDNMIADKKRQKPVNPGKVAPKLA